MYIISLKKPKFLKSGLENVTYLDEDEINQLRLFLF